MKRKNKILNIIAVTALTVMTLSVFASAKESNQPNANEGKITLSLSESAVSSEGAVPEISDASAYIDEQTGISPEQEDKKADAGLGQQGENGQNADTDRGAADQNADAGPSAVDEDEGLRASKESGENVFTQIYEYFTAYSGDIFGALAFVTSLILSLMFKSKLVPAISKGSDRLEKEIKRLGELTGNASCDLKAENGALSRLLCELKDTCEKNDKTLREALAKIKSTEELDVEKEKTRLVISSQVDLLYDIFMASSMTQYQKEKIGIEIAKMREKLAENE